MQIDILKIGSRTKRQKEKDALLPEFLSRIRNRRQPARSRGSRDVGKGVTNVKRIQQWFCSKRGREKLLQERQALKAAAAAAAAAESSTAMPSSSVATTADQPRMRSDLNDTSDEEDWEIDDEEEVEEVAAVHSSCDGERPTAGIGAPRP